MPNKHSQCDIYVGDCFVPEKSWHKTITYINAPAVGAKFYTQVKISFPFYINKIGFAPLKSGYVLRIVDGKLG